MAGSKINTLKKPDVKFFKLDFKIKNEKKILLLLRCFKTITTFVFKCICLLSLFCMSRFYLRSFDTFLHSKQRAMSSTINSHMNLNN